VAPPSKAGHVPLPDSDCLCQTAGLPGHTWKKYITQFEIRDKDKLTQPCSLLHFERQSWIDRCFGLHKGCLGRVAAS
jgi:hypothetical protein